MGCMGDICEVWEVCERYDRYVVGMGDCGRYVMYVVGMGGVWEV